MKLSLKNHENPPKTIEMPWNHETTLKNHENTMKNQKKTWKTMKLVVTGGYWLRGVTGDSAFKMKANVTNKQTPRWHYIKINQRYHLVFSAHLATEPSSHVRLLLHQLSVAFCRHLVVVVVLILLWLLVVFMTSWSFWLFWTVLCLLGWLLYLFFGGGGGVKSRSCWLQWKMITRCYTARPRPPQE